MNSNPGAPTENRDTPLRLMIVDDHPLIRRGLAMMLAAEPDINIVGQAGDGLEAIEQALALLPDVILMDLQMPRGSGVVATREITARLAATQVVVLTTYDHDDMVFEAIRAGAQAYLLKDAPEAEVLDTIRAVHRGESRMSPTIARKVMEQFRGLGARTDREPERDPERELLGTETPGGHISPQVSPTLLPESPPVNARRTATPHGLQESLTDKEQHILELLTLGKSNKQIANTVFLAEGTVKNYVSRIMGKLHACNRMELVLRAASQRE